MGKTLPLTSSESIHPWSVSPHDYSMEPIEKITDHEIWLLQTSLLWFESHVFDRFLHDSFMTAFACCNQVKMWKRLVSSRQRAVCMMNCPLEDMKSDFKEKHIQTSLVKLSWWWSVSYFSTSCQQLSLPLSPGQCSTERPHLLRVGRSGTDAMAQSIRIPPRNRGTALKGNSGPWGKIIKRQKKTFLPFRCETLRLLSASDSFNSSSSLLCSLLPWSTSSQVSWWIWNMPQMNDCWLDMCILNTQYL